MLYPEAEGATAPETLRQKDRASLETLERVAACGSPKEQGPLAVGHAGPKSLRPKDSGGETTGISPGVTR